MHDPEVLTRLADHVRAANAAVFGYDLDGFHPEDPVLLLRYTAGGHYTWHQDAAGLPHPFAGRKLTFVLQLSSGEDYEGGDLQLAGHHLLDDEATGRARALAWRAQGTLIVFPAWEVHRVAPVTSGERLALVGWAHGPALR